jgi:hypothetical protein
LRGWRSVHSGSSEAAHEQVDRFGHFGFRVKRPHIAIFEKNGTFDERRVSGSSLITKIIPNFVGNLLPVCEFRSFRGSGRTHGSE